MSRRTGDGSELNQLVGMAEAILEEEGEYGSEEAADCDPHELALGVAHEQESTDSLEAARDTAKANLATDPEYYSKQQAGSMAARDEAVDKQQAQVHIAKLQKELKASQDFAKQKHFGAAHIRRQQDRQKEIQRKIDSWKAKMSASVESRQRAPVTEESYKRPAILDAIQKIRGPKGAQAVSKYLPNSATVSWDQVNKALTNAGWQPRDILRVLPVLKGKQEARVSGNYTGPSMRREMLEFSDVMSGIGLIGRDQPARIEGNTTVLGNKDVKGKHPGDKDYERLDDILWKADGNEAKALQLVKVMAAAIAKGGGASSREKAHRRAKAAIEVFPGALGKQMARIFMDAAQKPVAGGVHVEAASKYPKGSSVKVMSSDKYGWIIAVVNPRGQVIDRVYDSPSKADCERKLDTYSMDRDGNRIGENIDSISDADCELEGAEFLRIMGLSESASSALGYA